MSDAAARYDVDINLRKVGDGWDDLSAGVGSFTSMIDRAAGKLASLGSYAALGAVTAGIAGLTFGVANLNAEAERAQISIGTIFSANGMSADVPSGIKLAGDTIAKMRIDAQKLPGEFTDLQNIFTTGAISAFRSGASIDQWRQTSAKAMAASAVAGLPMDQAARELAQLIEGRAGAHNVLGMRLMGLGGQKAEAFNKLDAGARMDQISATLDRYSGAIDAFAHSWEGVTSTFADNVKNFGRMATEPLFDEIKVTLDDINGWFSANQALVNHWTTHIGLELKHAFQWVKQEIEEWGPLVLNFVDTAESRIESMWSAAEPAVQSIAGALKEALADPNGTIDKLVHLGEMFLLLRGAGGIATTLGSASGRAGAGLGLAAAGVGGALIGADGGKPAGQAAEAGSAVGGGALAGSNFGPMGAVVGAALGAVSLAAASIVNYETVKRQGEEANTVATWKLGQTMWESNESLNAFKAKTGDVATTWMEASDRWAANLQANGDDAGAALVRLQASAMDAAFGLSAMFSRGAEQKSIDDGNRFTDTLMLGILQQSRNSRAAADAEARKPPQMKGGHGGTSIQKVEIVVTSNQNPSRIALAVHAQLAGLSVNKRYSPDVPNFSAPDEGR